jgi:hypothetical protein
MDHAGVAQYALSGCGLSGINVSRDTEISLIL